MSHIDTARACADRGLVREAARNYTSVILAGAVPEELMEAAVYLLENSDNYKLPYDCFWQLYNQGRFREDTLAIMRGAFYEPNVSEQKRTYERNKKKLKKYPYIFQKDFCAFEDLSLKFYPYDEGDWLLFDPGKGFKGHVKPNYPEIKRNFFSNLDNPILAEDVFSQYELEYLADNVRKSEFIGRDNHIYLHYKDWGEFCSYLQILDLRKALAEEKIVFLIGDELSLYPIDFKARFGLDYSQYEPRPIDVKEVKRLIWQPQLSAHNGSDFFNEIFNAHPNLLYISSIFFQDAEKMAAGLRDALRSCGSLAEAQSRLRDLGCPRLVQELYEAKKTTDKDFLVLLYMRETLKAGALDQNSRIAPALFFQPHFRSVYAQLDVAESGAFAVPWSEQYEGIRASSIFGDFPYIKTFIPLRRITTSCAATVRFVLKYSGAIDRSRVRENESALAGSADEFIQRLLNRGFLADPEDRLFMDSVMVRLEDGKLNPAATFSALAEFLDIPYTESMTYCSEFGKINPVNGDTGVCGFGLGSITASYDEYIDDQARYLLEYLLKDVYEFYGYGPQYYDGGEVDEAALDALLSGFEKADRIMEDIARTRRAIGGFEIDEAWENKLSAEMDEIREKRRTICLTLIKKPVFVSRKGRPLRMIPLLKPKESLLERPLYR